MTLALASTAERSEIRYGAFLVAFLFVCVLAGGANITNDETDQVFCVVRGACALDMLPRERQFLLEAILPNAFGAALAALGLKGGALIGVWILGGYAALAAAATAAVRRGALAFGAFALVVVAARWPEVAQHWIGKPDAYLAAALTAMATQERGPRRWLWALLATLCHPPIGVLSAMALVFFETETPRRADFGLLASAIGGYGLAKLALHWEAPGLVAREAFALANFETIAAQVRPYGFEFFAASFSGLAAIALGGLAPITATQRAKAARLLACLAAFWGFSAFLSLDHSRVFALLSGPLMLAAARQFKVPAPSLPALALVALVVSAGPHLDQLGYTSCGNLIAPRLFR
jgi:hypothetical protein